MAGKSETIQLSVNGRKYAVEAPTDTPLLWVLRERLGLTGTKYGCGIAQCGACTVLANGDAIRSCVTPVSSVIGKEITTIEGLSADRSHPLQQAWIDDRRAAVRVLPVRADHGGRGPAGPEEGAERCRHRCGHVRCAVPLRDLPAHTPRHPPCRRKIGKGRCNMSEKTTRKVYKTEPVAGGCLVLGFHVPVRRASDAAAASASLCSQCLHPHRQGRDGHPRGQQVGDGTGGLHGPAHADLRRARGGLEQGPGGIGVLHGEGLPPHELGSAGDGRKLQCGIRVGAAAQGRGGGAGDADFGRSGHVPG